MKKLPAAFVLGLVSACLLCAPSWAQAAYGRTDISIEPVHTKDNPGFYSLSDVRMYTVSTDPSGLTCVVEGLVQHQYPHPRSIYIGLDFLDTQDKSLLRTGQFVSGKTLSLTELKQGGESFLAQFVSDMQHSSGANIEPGEKTPFMFVVQHTPKTADSYVLKVLYSAPAASEDDSTKAQGSPSLVLRDVRWDLVPGPVMGKSPLAAHIPPVELANDIVLLQGQVLNISGEPLKAVRIEAFMYDSQHKILQREESFAGIDQQLSPANAEQGQQTVLAPGAEVPFTIPFIMPEEAVSFEVKIVDKLP